MNDRNFFKCPETGQVHEYSAEQIAGGHVRDGLFAITAEEAEALLTPPALSARDVELIRLSAYAHPITGCDRFKAEADAERLAGNEEAALAAEKKLLDRREQIKAENPWPKAENK